jgi:hypothetical protein
MKFISFECKTHAAGGLFYLNLMWVDPKRLKEGNPASEVTVQGNSAVQTTMHFSIISLIANSDLEKMIAFESGGRGSLQVFSMDSTMCLKLRRSKKGAKVLLNSEISLCHDEMHGDHCVLQFRDLEVIRMGVAKPSPGIY